MENLTIGDELFLDIKRLGINGEGIGFYKRLAIFVDGALPKENVKVRITNVNQKYATAELVKIVTPAEERCDNFCQYYTKCGGCSIQHVLYQAQGDLKRDILMESLSRYTGVNPRQFEVKKTILMDDSLNYRTKVNMPCRNGIHGVVFGLYSPNSEKFIRVVNCPVQNEKINLIVGEISKVMDKLVIKAYDGKTKKGNVRFLVVRESLYSGKAQVTFILYKPIDRMMELAKEVMKIEGVDSVNYSVNNDTTDNSIFGAETVKVLGNDSLIEQIGDYKFKLLPNSFFQLNPKQAKVLYDEVKKASKLSMKEKVIDAFCGVGSIGIYLAKYSKEVVGIESNKQAVINAKENADLNKVKNIRFIEGNVTNVLPYLVKDNFVPDVMVFDPPRTGMTKEIIEAILKCLPKRIVYVSCNPASLAKDLRDLVGKYKIKYIQPIDMFPYTAHVETVVLLGIKEPKNR